MAKAYEELEIRDDFMYGKVTEDLEITRLLLEMATGRKIEKLELGENQKTIIATMEGKDVRLDSYVEDEEKVVYDSEMHNRSNEDIKSDPQLPKRSRYYQGMIDINILEGGARYQELKQSYIVFFCTFDPFGKGLKRYTFENTCKEDPSLKLDDKSTKIFFNTKGEKDGIEKTTDKQQAFLHYVETGEATDELTKQIDSKVKEIREDKKWRSAYMKTLTHDQDVYDSGHEAGMKTGHESGLKEGRESGLKEGRESGLKEGHESGLKEGRESGLKALVKTLKPIFKTPEKVHENIVSHESFEDTTIEDVKKYW